MRKSLKRRSWKVKQNQENSRGRRVQEGGVGKLQGRKSSRRRSWKTPGEEGFKKEELKKNKFTRTNVT